MFGKNTSAPHFWNSRKSIWFCKSQVREQLSQFKSVQPASLMNEKLDLEQLVWTPSISAQLRETFDLSWAKPFENPVFRPQSQGGKIRLGEAGLHDGATTLSHYPNRYPFWTVRTPQASLVGEQYTIFACLRPMEKCLKWHEQKNSQEVFSY